ncbi:synaptotagmin-like protein 1 isoform X1 [Callorhinchus milii]|uniref:Synaptotagmin-like protein 1 n=1 Tax=Callorhinchus milii TaxID=7868 RepID=A0A4W3K3Z6_CALMI|nr:synaptotagmin-like protein 1 isoform X1 [Callorhinchus milii]XP_007893137.1 synaptotagmin-like protein 1 isoform X1 [Callorhinchus milii]XP_007893138.1 synaptotagmin-like protein 1 isoform X1 [Callorhinchus milii]|eukprot:gi/632954765/ref/XP_007893136.1/ PREDICTED: synaptotagmin-like protein 1 isoform X1 [Callorhinchus milii]
MELGFDVENLIDLSFLTEQEQDLIVAVLSRDAELRSLEENRIRKLQQSILDPEQLKIASGEWFKDVRAKRHKDQQFGSDIVRASIRKRKKKGEREKKVTINDEKIIINEQEQQKPLSEKIPESITVNSEMAITEQDNTDGKDRTDWEELQINERVEKHGDNLSTSKEKKVTSESHQNEFGDDIEAEITVPGASDDLVCREKSLVPDIQIQDELSEDDVCSEPSSGTNKDLDVTNSLSSLQSSNLSGSMMSLYSNVDFGCVDVKGSIQFSLHYDNDSQEFQILVDRCYDLAEAKKKRSDPYVKSYLLPDNTSESKRKTSVKKKTLNPIFNDWLKYKMEKSELQTRTLNLSVWHNDSFRHNIFLGEVEIPLESWDWSHTNPVSLSLQPRIAIAQSTIQNRGQLSFSLQFIPRASKDPGKPPSGELHIWLRDARNLIPLRSKGVNSFAKCYILPDTSKSSRQKTRVIKKSLHPVYNHTMVYDGFETEDLREICAEFTVWDHDAFSTRLLGGVRLSMGTGLSYGKSVTWMDSTEEEIAVWQNMISRPLEWVDSILPLRSNVDPGK